MIFFYASGLAVARAIGNKKHTEVVWEKVPREDNFRDTIPRVAHIERGKMKKFHTNNFAAGPSLQWFSCR